MDKKSIVSISVVALLFLGLVFYARFGNNDNKQTENRQVEGLGVVLTPKPTVEPTSIATSKTKMNEDADKLKIEDLKVGSGTEAVSGKKVTVNYSGTLVDGTKFDSSYDRGTPFSFNLGAGEVIKGWDQGVAGMKVGGKRKLTIPPSLGYGSQAVGTIPANSVLVFEVELLKVE